MKKTTQIIVMAALCLNFCYGQEKENCSKQTKSSQEGPSQTEPSQTKQSQIKQSQTNPKQTKSSQVKPKNSSVNQPYKYDFSGFKSGYQSGYRISDDEFMKGKSITVRNYTITQLFALALRLQNSNSDSSAEQVDSKNQIIIDVRQPEKLKEIRCYQLVVPFYLTDNFYIIMQQSLNEEFPEYIVKIERRGDANCMVIKDKVY